MFIADHILGHCKCCVPYEDECTACSASPSKSYIFAKRSVPSEGYFNILYNFTLYLSTALALFVNMCHHLSLCQVGK